MTTHTLAETLEASNSDTEEFEAWIRVREEYYEEQQRQEDWLHQEEWMRMYHTPNSINGSWS